VTPPIGFTDFDPPEALEPAEAPASPKSARAPRSRRDDFYDTPIVDGKPAPNSPVSRLRDIMRALFISAGEREEAQLETTLRRLPGVSRTNIVATLSPKGGCGKTTSTFLTGNVLASHLRLRALAVDLNPDFGTLADLAPDRTRAPLSLVDLLRDKGDIASPGELRPYVSRLPSGLHLLAAPPDPAVMAQMTPELYGELLEFLRRFYEVILLDLGTGITAPIATFAVEQADQVVVVTTPEWITNTKVQMALGHLRLDRATLVLNKVDGSAAQKATERQFSRDRIAQRVAVPTDLQLKTMLDSGTFSLAGLGRATRVPIKRLGLAVGTQLA
jgi:MinD-like ATPase involved in chromosome partitioning or flagellar assembly